MDNVKTDNMLDNKEVLIVSPKFNIGDIVRHKLYPFRGVIVDIDPIFSNSDDWYESIPKELRPKKNQPFYHLLAENSETFYSAYVSQQNLLSDSESGPINHPEISDLFTDVNNGKYILRDTSIN